MSAQAFWDKAAPLIAVTEKHPFLVAMVDATLEMENFRYYVVQDALYLGDFADCLRRLGDHDGIPEADAKRLHAFAKGAQEAEMSLHNSFFKTWTISADGVEQAPNTLLYTSYMKRIVVTQGYAEGLACLLPCFWVYMHVGKCMLKLRKDLGDKYVCCVCVFVFIRVMMFAGCWSLNCLLLYVYAELNALLSLTHGLTCTEETTLNVR